jgi:hypothetical protein
MTVALKNHVCTDKPRLFARIERERGLFEERFRAAGKAELIEANHGVRPRRVRENAILDCRWRSPRAHSCPVPRWPFGRMFFAWRFA